MAKRGLKSITMVQEMVMTLSLPASWVLTSTTGPGSIRVKALLRLNGCMKAPLKMLPSLRVRTRGVRGAHRGMRCGGCIAQALGNSRWHGKSNGRAASPEKLDPEQDFGTLRAGFSSRPPNQPHNARACRAQVVHEAVLRTYAGAGGRLMVISDKHSPFPRSPSKARQVESRSSHLHCDRELRP